VPDIRFIGFDETAYCDNQANVKLEGNLIAGVFSGKAVTGNASSGYYFEPRLAVPGLDTVYYTYTTTRGCSRQIFKPLTIRGAAEIKFTVQDTCFSSNETDSVVFINLTTSDDPVVSWIWIFGDATSGKNDTSFLENPKHRYNKDGMKVVTLSASTNYCESKSYDYFTFGAKPQG